MATARLPPHRTRTKSSKQQLHHQRTHRARTVPSVRASSTFGPPSLTPLTAAHVLVLWLPPSHELPRVAAARLTPDKTRTASTTSTSAPAHTVHAHSSSSVRASSTFRPRSIPRVEPHSTRSSFRAGFTPLTTHTHTHTHTARPIFSRSPRVTKCSRARHEDGSTQRTRTSPLTQRGRPIRRPSRRPLPIREVRPPQRWPAR